MYSQIGIFKALVSLILSHRIFYSYNFWTLCRIFFYEPPRLQHKSINLIGLILTCIKYAKSFYYFPSFNIDYLLSYCHIVPLSKQNLYHIYLYLKIRYTDN